MKKTAIVGQYGQGPSYVTGQAVKTYFIARWMMKRFGPENVEIVNTYGWKKRPVGLMVSLVRAMLRCRNVIILPAQHGVKVFAPLVAGLNRLFRRRTFYVVIGGWLADTLKGDKRLKKAVAAFDGVCAETESLAEDLRRVGIQNAWYLPNCRDYAADPGEKDMSEPVRVCTYSRVTQTKGIEDAAAIVKKANALLGKNVFFLEVYGGVAPEYKDAFDALCRENGDVMGYMGVKNADEAVSTLKDQFALLFPTYYEGECFAGTVLDAFSSRTPIIANDWKYNREVVIDGENGFLYPFRDTDAAAERLARLYREKDTYRAIQAGCEQSARRYDSDRVLEALTSRMA